MVERHRRTSLRLLALRIQVYSAFSNGQTPSQAASSPPRPLACSSVEGMLSSVCHGNESNSSACLPTLPPAGDWICAHCSNSNFQASWAAAAACFVPYQHSGASGPTCSKGLVVQHGSSPMQCGAGLWGALGRH
jgi:hypothetical protein